MNIRKYNKNDNEKIYNLFYNTVHSIKKKSYTKKQLNLWAKRRIDIDKWCEKFVNTYTIIAEDNNEIIGFSNINNDGYIDNLYVHKDYQNKKVATELLKNIENYSMENNMKNIFTYSSINAKAFFEKSGYAVEEENILILGNEELKIYLMKKER